jgi:hypothetical protein
MALLTAVREFAPVMEKPWARPEAILLPPKPVSSRLELSTIRRAPQLEWLGFLGLSW